MPVRLLLAALAALLAVPVHAVRVISPVPCRCVAEFANCSVPPSGQTDSYGMLMAVHAACPDLALSHHELHPHVHEALLAPAVVIGLGAFVRHFLLATGLPLPYTVVMLVVGLVVGLMLNLYVTDPLYMMQDTCTISSSRWSDQLQRSFTTLASLDPHLLLHVFIPPLIYESASAIEWHIFFQLKRGAFLLAVPGVIASTFLLGGLVNALYGTQPSDLGVAYDWPADAGIMLGVILSATDPVAVVALLKDLGVKEELAIGIEAESLFNDGTALVFFQIFLELVQVCAFRMRPSMSALCLHARSTLYSLPTRTHAARTHVHAASPTAADFMTVLARAGAARDRADGQRGRLRLPI